MELTIFLSSDLGEGAALLLVAAGVCGHAVERIEVGARRTSLFSVGGRGIEHGVEGAIVESFAQRSVVINLGLLRGAQLPRKGNSVFLIVRIVRLSAFLRCLDHL